MTTFVIAWFALSLACTACSIVCIDIGRRRSRAGCILVTIAGIAPWWNLAVVLIDLDILSWSLWGTLLGHCPLYLVAMAVFANRKLEKGPKRLYEAAGIGALCALATTAITCYLMAMWWSPA